jgi:hypothetical protein
VLLEIQHVLEIGSIIADGAHGGARQHGSEQRGETSAHDARDLNHPVSASSNPALVRTAESPLRCEYALLADRCPPSF